MTTHASRPRLRLLAAALASLALLGSAGALASTYQLNYKIPGLVKKAPVSEQAPAPEADTDFTSHTFTTCGQAGRLGPSQAQCETAYAGQEILKPAYSFSVTDGYQHWTVPADGSYRITAYGAAGGKSKSSTYFGKGARISGVFDLKEGDELLILVGQKGADNIPEGNSGGGGGTFVASGANYSSASPLLVAGGGAGTETTITDYAAMDGWAAERGQAGGGGQPYGNAYGISGQGGHYSGSSNSGGGGGGFYGDGTSSKQFDPASLFNGGEGGQAFVNGGTGGRSWHSHGYGGFGGGAGSYGSGGGAGGGGGYSGGENGNNRSNHTGGGGGSYNAGTSQTSEAGVNDSQGKVIIEKL